MERYEGLIKARFGDTAYAQNMRAVTHAYDPKENVSSSMWPEASLLSIWSYMTK